MNNDDPLRFAPKEWREIYERTVNMPWKGPMQDEHGIVHEIFGNHTACGKTWAGHNRFDRLQHNKGWTTPPEGTAFTCFACLHDIHLPSGD